MSIKNKAPTHKICCKCNASKPIKEGYYMASDDLIYSDGRLPICKTCLVELVDMNDVDSVVEVLRKIDKPFILSEYESSLTYNNPFGEYMRRMAMRQNRSFTYMDSEFSKELSEYIPKSEIEIVGDSDLIETDVAQLQAKWGKFDKEEYIFLENFYREYSNNYATDTPVQVNLYKNIAKVQLQAEKELQAGSIKTYKDLMDLSSKLHNDGNIKPIQSTGMNDDKGLSTYGLWIKEIEKEEPCEYFEDKPLYEDYDKLKKYWENWFVRPFKNIFNVSKDFNVRDDD